MLIDIPLDVYGIADDGAELVKVSEVQTVINQLNIYTETIKEERDALAAKVEAMAKAENKELLQLAASMAEMYLSTRFFRETNAAADCAALTVLRIKQTLEGVPEKLRVKS
jgi:hypothetical protein